MNDKKDAYEKLAAEVNYFTRKWKLKYSFRSLCFILEKERLSLAQCADGLFPTSVDTDNDVKYDPIRACKILLMAGDNRIGSDTSYDELEKTAFDRMEEWRKKVKAIEMLHIYLVYILKEEHFFSGALPTGHLIENLLVNVKTIKSENLHTNKSTLNSEKTT